jgi:hypothetical protein
MLNCVLPYKNPTAHGKGLSSDPANKGWPGMETKKIIPVDSNKEYTFSAS